MPIRFRCAYCNQLMGISTRKAGTVVKCPKCAGEIIVPSPDSFQPGEEPATPPAVEPPAEQPEAPAASPGGGIEAKEFDAYFQEAANGSVGATAPVRSDAAVPIPEPPALPPPPPPQRRGLFLTIPMLILCMIVIFMLLVAVFVMGVVIGRHSAPSAASPSSAASRSLRSIPL